MTPPDQTARAYRGPTSQPRQFGLGDVRESLAQALEGRSPKVFMVEPAKAIGFAVQVRRYGQPTRLITAIPWVDGPRGGLVGHGWERVRYSGKPYLERQFTDPGAAVAAIVEAYEVVYRHGDDGAWTITMVWLGDRHGSDPYRGWKGDLTLPPWSVKGRVHGWDVESDRGDHRVEIAAAPGGIWADRAVWVDGKLVAQLSAPAGQTRRVQFQLDGRTAAVVVRVPFSRNPTWEWSLDIGDGELRPAHWVEPSPVVAEIQRQAAIRRIRPLRSLMTAAQRIGRTRLVILLALALLAVPIVLSGSIAAELVAAALAVVVAGVVVVARST